MTRKRLLVDMHSFDSPLLQGITTHLHGLYTRLPKMAPDIEFIFAAHDIDRIRRIFGEGDNIRYRELKSKGRIRRLSFEFPLLAIKVRAKAAHFQYVGPPVKTCPTIITLHDILFMDYANFFPLSYRMTKAPAFEMSARQADLLCVVSEYTRSRILSHYNIPREEIAVIPNGVDEDFFNPDVPRLPEMPDKYILYVSRIEPRKNHAGAIEAFDRLGLADKGYSLVMIGAKAIPSPEIAAAMMKMSPSAREKVIFYGQVDQQKLHSWYHHASLFIYPALAEGFGIPPLEAAAAGVPVICNNATSMSDFTFFGDNLIDVNNRRLLDNRILENLSRPPENLDKIADTVRTIYNWDTAALSFLEHLRNLMK